MKEHSYRDNVGHYFAIASESELQGIMTGKVHYLTRLPKELKLKQGDVIFLVSENAVALARSRAGAGYSDTLCAIEVSEVLDMTPKEAFGRFKAALPANFNDDWSICSKVTLIRISDVRVLGTWKITSAMGVKPSQFLEAGVRLVRINKPIGYKGNSFYFIGKY